MPYIKLFKNPYLNTMYVALYISNCFQHIVGYTELSHSQEPRFYDAGRVKSQDKCLLQYQRSHHRRTGRLLKTLVAWG